jgi:hypothetical protein
MRPGKWCSYCAAKTVCPARDADLINRSGDLLTSLTAAGGALSKQGLTANDVIVARANDALTEDRKLGMLYEIAVKAENLAARVRDEIKAKIVSSNGSCVPQTSKGYLVVRRYKKENISKKSLRDAYGVLGAERRLKALRADGALTETEVEQLWPEEERGR